LDSVIGYCQQANINGREGGIALNCMTHGPGGFSNCITYNCVADGNSTGFYVPKAYTNTNIKVYIRNCVAINCTTAFNINSGLVESKFSNNAADQVVGYGADNIDNIDKYACFENPDGFDFHLKAGSPLNETGYDLSGVNDTDIDWQPWTVPYSIGFDQPWVFTVPIIISCLTSLWLPIEWARVYCEEWAVGPWTQWTEIMNVLSDVNWEALFDYPYWGTPQEIQKWRSRKSSSAPFFKTWHFFWEIWPDGLSTTSVMVSDD